jgi:hypothetical protein
MKKIIFIFSIVITFILFSCNQGPKTIGTPVESETDASAQPTGIFSDEGGSTSSHSSYTTGDVHTVKVIEVLDARKYVYLKVEENGEEFWIATGHKEISVGETYFYKNGILKTNFESKEHNRIFDKVYLVANIVPATHGNQTIKSPLQKENTDNSVISSQYDVEGSISISELVVNKEEYSGKEVQITAKVDRMNANILDRNWIHLKDGSKDDFDLVITSAHQVPVGHVVTMKGTVVLDKDFGGGYIYEIIIENGQIVSKK